MAYLVFQWKYPVVDRMSQNDTTHWMDAIPFNIHTIAYKAFSFVTRNVSFVHKSHKFKRFFYAEASNVKSGSIAHWPINGYVLGLYANLCAKNIAQLMHAV